MKLKLVWHAENLSEVDWLRAILGGLIDEEIVDLDFAYHGDDSIHVVSGAPPLRDHKAYFKQCRDVGKNIALVHLSDEWLSGGYEVYGYFDLVIRNYWTRLADGPGIITIPLGFSNEMENSKPVRLADQRKYAWSFTGQLKASRLEMVAALSSLEPHVVTDISPGSDRPAVQLSKAAFKERLSETVFAPCPMGNVVVDTWRLYESLECGCIPLVESRRTLDYYRRLLGPHPIPTFRTWTAARRYCQQLIEDTAGLTQKQDEIAAWWNALKDRLRAQLRQGLTGPSQAAELQAFSNQPHNRYPLLHEPQRLVELLRHQSANSFRRRLARPIGPMKRVWRETFRPRTA